MSWSFVQLNRAFSSREAVHIPLARMDQRVLSGLRTRESGLVGGEDGRVEKGRGWKVTPPFGARRQTLGGGDCLGFLYLSPSFII